MILTGNLFTSVHWQRVKISCFHFYPFRYLLQKYFTRRLNHPKVSACKRHSVMTLLLILHAHKFKKWRYVNKITILSQQVLIDGKKSSTSITFLQTCRKFYAWHIISNVEKNVFSNSCKLWFVVTWVCFYESTTTLHNFSHSCNTERIGYLWMRVCRCASLHYFVNVCSYI